MLKHVILSLAFIGILFCSCASNGGPETAQLEKKMGRQAVEIIEMSPWIVSFPVKLNDHRQILPAGEEKILSNAQVKKIEELFLNDEHFDFEKTKKCLFIPETGLKFDENLTIYVSLSCQQLKVVTNEKIAILDFDPIADQMNAFFQELNIHEEAKS